MFETVVSSMASRGLEGTFTESRLFVYLPYDKNSGPQAVAACRVNGSPALQAAEKTRVLGSTPGSYRRSLVQEPQIQATSRILLVSRVRLRSQSDPPRICNRPRAPNNSSCALVRSASKTVPRKKSRSQLETIDDESPASASRPQVGRRQTLRYYFQTA